jgi:hypothetical protein
MVPGSFSLQCRGARAALIAGPILRCRPPRGDLGFPKEVPTLQGANSRLSGAALGLRAKRQSGYIKPALKFLLC